MSRLLTDSWEQERHSSLKRWERGAQRVAWTKRSAEHTALPLPCPWRELPDDPLSFFPAHVLALFSGDLAVVRFVQGPALFSPDTADSNLVREAPGLDSSGVRVVRGGFPWERWCPVILKAYLNGAPVPEPFRLRHRLPPQWLEHAQGWSTDDQVAFMNKLRENGFLSPLRVVTPEAVAPWLRWDEMRARLIDTKG